MLAAGAAAAFLLSTAPAHAGVKFEKVTSKKVRTRFTWSQSNGSLSACHAVSDDASHTFA